MAANILFKQQCPSCEAMISIKDSKLIGKKVECPKCKYRLVVENPEAAKEDEEAKPAKKTPLEADKGKDSKATLKSKAGAKADGKSGLDPKKTVKGKPSKPVKKAEEEDDLDEDLDEDLLKAKSKRGSTKLLVGLGVAGLAVALLAVAGYFIFFKEDATSSKTVKVPPTKGPSPTKKTETSKAKENPATTKKPELELPDPSNLLPGDTEMVLNLHLQNLRKSPLGKALLDVTTGFKIERTLEEKTGLGQEEIEQMVLAANYRQKWVFLVVRTVKPLKLETLKKLQLEKAEPIKGQEYFLEKSLGLDVAVRLCDERTLVVASLEPMKKFLDFEGTPPLQTKGDQPVAGMPGVTTKSAGKRSSAPYLTIEPGMKVMLDRLEAHPPVLFSCAVNVGNLLERDEFKKLPSSWPKLAEVHRVLSLSSMAGMSLNAETGMGGMTRLECKNDNDAKAVAKELRGQIEAVSPKLPFLKWNDPADPAGKSEPPVKPVADGKPTLTIDGPSAEGMAVHLTLKLDQKAFEAVFEDFVAPQLNRLKGTLDLARIQPEPQELGKALGSATEKEQPFPRGTYLRKIPPQRQPFPDGSGRPFLPDQRIGWMPALLPHLGKGDLFKKINFENSWRDPQNLNVASTLIPNFIDPDYPIDARYVRPPGLRTELAATHFVGVAGVGLDAAEYSDADPNTRKLRGVFGYERVTPLADVSDQTIVVLQVPPSYTGPWLAGGGSTVRGVPETKSIQPFVSSTVNGKHGTMAVFKDGSVRFIADDISDKVFQELCVIDKDKPKIDLAPWPVMPPKKKDDSKPAPPAR